MAKKRGNTAMWVLMGLLILGLGGFGATSFTGSLRSVASVGSQDITPNEYGRALQNELRALEAQAGQAISFEQAQSAGIDRQVLARLISEAAVDDEADRIGLSVGDTTVAKQVQDIPAFKGIDGKFDRESYKFALDRVGMSESEFERGLRRETSRALVQGAVVSGKSLPDSYIDTILSYVSERRRVSWVRLDSTLLPEETLAPSEEDLKALYEERIADFTRPEIKRITYAWLTPEMILDQVEVDEDLLRAEYEARAADYNRPERRLVERLVYADEGRAQAAKDQLDSGASDFDTLVADRGLDLNDIDMGDVSKADLGAAGEQVFAAQSGDVVGPIDTDLGPAFFRVNGILAAETTSYEDALPELRAEVATDRARRRIAGEAEPAEDLLASGATLEELAADSDLTLGTIDWAPGQNEGIAAYEGFDEAAEALTQDDYPEIAQLSDGTIYAMRLDEVIAPEPAPFEDVRERVNAIWETRQTMERLRGLAADYMGKLAEAADFASLGLEVNTEEALTRNGTVLGAPDDFAARVFDMEEGDMAVIDGFGAVLIARLDEVLPPNPEDPETAGLRNNIQQQMQNSLAQDLYRAFAEDVRIRAGAEIDQSAIAAVNANFQ